MTSKMSEKVTLITSICTCNLKQPLADGTVPLYLTDLQEALDTLKDLWDRSPTRYWAVHYNGRHVLNARIDGNLLLHDHLRFS